MWPVQVPSLVTALMKLHNLASNEGSICFQRGDLRHFMLLEQNPCVFVNDGNLIGKTLQERRTQRRMETQHQVDNSTRLAVTDHLQRVGATRPPHSRYRVRNHARTKQFARVSNLTKRPARRIAAAPPMNIIDLTAETTPPPSDDAGEGNASGHMTRRKRSRKGMSYTYVSK